MTEVLLKRLEQKSLVSISTHESEAFISKAENTGMKVMLKEHKQVTGLVISNIGCFLV
jgi:hypothetical protein